MNQPKQQQDPPGIQSEMTPVPDCGEESYRGSGQLTGKVAVITGADSGIGRAVAIAYAREGADVVISYLSEDSDAKEVAEYVEDAGQRAVLIKGDLVDAQHCRDIIAKTVADLGRIDILVNNAAYQMNHTSLEEIPDEEWDYTFDTNIRAMFHLCKAAVPHMQPGSSIIGSSSVNSDMPSPQLAPYAATKAAIANFCASLAQLLGEQGIRVNSVAPGPDLDTPDPGDHAAGEGREVRRRHPVGSRRPTRRTGTGLRTARLRGRQLHLRGPHRRDRRPPDLVAPALEMSMGRCRARWIGWTLARRVATETSPGAVMAESEQSRNRTRRTEQEPVEELAPADTAHKAELDADVDSLLEEIDDVLETNAEEFVRSFVQKGGQ